MNRSAGILLAVSSLPSRYGIGSFSSEAYRFVDFLADAGQTYWQILPLSPANHDISKDSPYQAFSAFAGNPYYIDLDALVSEGVLTREEVDGADFGSDPEHVNYDKLYATRLPLLRRAYERSNIAQDEGYRGFVRDNGWWLDDYALFMACKAHFDNAAWMDWPEDIRRHWGFALEYYHRTLYYDVEFHKYLQYKVFQQWYALKRYANERHIRIVGDIPIYVSMDSADVWAHAELFQLLDGNRQSAVAGCPPDAFAADGQIWGTPLYRWDEHRSQGYGWWMARLWHNFNLCDLLRIDHFRGLDEYFSIPAESTSARDGHWEPGPGMDLFRKMWENMGYKPVIVEDLGYMTDSVRELVRQTGFPNMKVLQFGFDEQDLGGANDYLMHNVPEHCVCYTGTHDNAPTQAWFESLPEQMKGMIRRYFAAEQVPEAEIYKVFVAHAMMSRAETTIIPIQDHLGLGMDARMNEPSRAENNWHWRLDGRLLTDAFRQDLKEQTRRYGRLNWENER